MKFNVFIFIILFGLISQESKEFTFQFCSDENGEVCLDQIYNEDSFQSTIINSIYQESEGYDNILIKQNDISDEITINIDNINNFIKIHISNQSFYSPVTIQTSLEKDTDTESFNCPNIFAPGRHLQIENINPKNNLTVFIHHDIQYDKISEKNKSKPLYMVNMRSFYYVYNYEKDISPILYLGYDDFHIEINSEFNESRSIISSPLLLYDYDNYYIAYSWIYIDTHVPAQFIYGENKITIEFQNSKTLTVITENRRVEMHLVLYNKANVTVEEGINEYDLVSPIIESMNDDLEIEIQGNWPAVKNEYIEEEYIGNGSILEDFYKSFRLDGQFLFSANNFPFEYGHFTLVLTKNKSSIYYVDNDDEIFYNITIRTRDEVETIFIVNGFATSTQNDDYYKSFLISESPLLKIYVNAKDDINVIGPGSFAYQTIDNRWKTFDSVLNFLNGGSIIIPYGLDYEQFFSKIQDIYDDYDKINPRPFNNASSHIWFDYCIHFTREKISDLSFLINNLENSFYPSLNINLIDDDSYKPNKKSIITLIRGDVPITSLYSNELNKESSVLCLQNGVFNLSEWDIKIDKRMLRGFGDEGSLNDYFFDEFAPQFKDTTFSFDKKLTDDGHCISIIPKSIPNSVFEFFVYTTNETFIEILDKINIVNILSPLDLDASSKIINKKTKNFMILILEDLPEGSSINLNGISRESNIFLIGFKSNSIEKVLECFEKNKELNKVEFAKYISQFASQYLSFQPTVSLTINTVQTLFCALVNYTGTKIHCTKFWAIASSFPNLVKNSNDFSSQFTITETLTYKHISSLPFTDLVIFPISIDPLNVLKIEQVNFTEKGWTLKMTEFIKEEGYTKDDFTFYTIDKKNIRNDLYLYTFYYSCEYLVPEEKEKQEIKGISFNCFNLLEPKLSEIVGIFILEDNKEEEDNKKSPFHSILNSLKSFQNLVKLTKEENEENDGFKFTGNWDKVSSIEGKFEIDVGNAPAIIENVPSIVAESLDVKSDKIVQITSQNENMFFSKPLIISKAKTVSFENKEMIVTFSNLTFNGNVASLSLLINGNPSKVVTNHIMVESGTYAKISSDVEVKESIEVGPESSLNLNLNSPLNVKLTLNYRLNTKFGSIPDSIEPTEIILNYIGESDDLNDEIDYSIYSNILNDIRKFNSTDHKEKCDEWKLKTSLHSDLYPEFRVKGQVVDFICINEISSTVFTLKVTSVPKGEVILPTDNDDFISPTDNGGHDGGGTKNDKKKFPFFALVGIIVGAIVLIAIVIILTVVYKSMSKKQKNKDDKNNEDSLGENTGENLPSLPKEVEPKENIDNKVKAKPDLQNSPENNDDDSDIDFWLYP